MDALTISAASGIQARMESLEMLANNISNQATAGFKTDREFYSLYRTASGSDFPVERPAPALPVVERQWTDFSQGSITPTGNPLDLALLGPGFFTVDGPNGPLYTRNGQFHLDNDGALRSQEGYPVLDRSGAAVQLDPSRTVEFTADGAIHQEGTPVAELCVVEFAEPGALSKLAGTYFASAVPGTSPPQSSATQVYQGRLEGANAAPAEAAVRLVGVMRQFEMLQKAVRLGSEMNRRAVEEVAKVNG
jgi:flagellar basal body rod protein FlgG